jgi:serine protease inhibitor
MAIEDYIEKYNAISRTMMERFTKEKNSENIVFSPMSIIMLLGMAADAVSGKSREEILNVVGGGMAYDEFMGTIKSLQADMSYSKSLMSSNAVCVKENISGSIEKAYIERLKEIFDGRLFASENLIQDVNAWVREKTRGMITDVMDESMKHIVACLMNAIAFESDWLEQYEESDIYEDDFHSADGKVSKVQMMDSTEEIYVEDDFFAGFIKPYKDEKYALMALLPKKKGRAFMLQAIKQIDLSKMYAGAVNKTVYASMPEFNADFGENLTELCKNLGVNTVFTPEADFSPMSTEWLMIDSIIHKAHIEVDRKGTKAAAATMAFMVCGCIPNMDGETVILNRPFVYAIMDTKMGLPIFAGIYNNAGK